VFYLRLSKAAMRLDARASRWVGARSRCCEPCRRRVERVEIWRILATLSMMLAIAAPAGLAWLFDAWDTKLTGAMLAGLMAWWAAGILVPVLLFRRFHDRVRGLLESVWVVEMLRGEVEMPSGMPIYDLVNIYAKHHGDEPPVDLSTLAG